MADRFSVGTIEVAPIAPMLVHGNLREQRLQSKPGLGGNLLPLTHRVVEDSRKTLARPLNTAGIRGKWQNSAAYSVAEPFQELFLVAFGHHWIAADPEQRNHCLVFLKLSIEPIGPLRHSRKSVNLGYRCPH